MKSLMILVITCSMTMFLLGCGKPADTTEAPIAEDADKVAADKAAADKVEADKAAAEKVAAEKVADAQKAAAIEEAAKRAAEKVAADKAAADKKASALEAVADATSGNGNESEALKDLNAMAAKTIKEEGDKRYAKVYAESYALFKDRGLSNTEAKSQAEDKAAAAKQAEIEHVKTYFISARDAIFLEEASK